MVKMPLKTHLAPPNQLRMLRPISRSSSKGSSDSVAGMSGGPPKFPRPGPGVGPLRKERRPLYSTLEGRPMTKRWSLLSVALLFCALWAGLPTLGQDQPDRGDPAERLARIETRLAEIETHLGQLSLASSASQRPLPSASRIDRLEQRVGRLESGAGALSYRPGGASSMLESRLRTLEREVSRLRR